VPMPGAGRIAHYVADPDHVHAIRVGDDADAFSEDQVLAAVVLVGHGSHSRAEVHRQGIQARQHAADLTRREISRPPARILPVHPYGDQLSAHREVPMSLDS
jgi:hypothetical protein